MDWPMDVVRRAVEAGEVTAEELAAESKMSLSSVSRALRHKCDVPESTMRRYFAAMIAIRENKNSLPVAGAAPVGDARGAQQAGAGSVGDSAPASSYVGE